MYCSNNNKVHIKLMYVHNIINQQETPATFILFDFKYFSFRILFQNTKG